MSDETEIAAIESAMQDTRGEYYNGPKDDTGHTPMQTRYKELTEAKEAAPPPDTTTATPPASAERDVAPASPTVPAEPTAEATAYWQSQEGQVILTEWQKGGGVDENIKAGIALANDLSETLPPETRVDFEEQFGKLSAGVQMGILAELSNPYIKVSQASAKEVTQFSNSTPEAGDMVEEWGANAPRRITTFRARFKRARDRMSADDKSQLDGFIDHITPEEFKTVMRYFAGAV